jgi:hypothetical protein
MSAGPIFNTGISSSLLFLHTSAEYLCVICSVSSWMCASISIMHIQEAANFFEIQTTKKTGKREILSKNLV